MVSTVLIFPTIDYTPGNDMPTQFYLPTYTTTAWFHHLLAPDLQNESLEQVTQQARDFADGEYAQALMKGDKLTPGEREKIVKDLAHFTRSRRNSSSRAISASETPAGAKNSNAISARPSAIWTRVSRGKTRMPLASVLNTTRAKLLTRAPGSPLSTTTSAVT